VGASGAELLFTVSTTYKLYEETDKEQLMEMHLMMHHARLSYGINIERNLTSEIAFPGRFLFPLLTRIYSKHIYYLLDDSYPKDWKGVS
jgi:hypothetical protein